MREQSTMVIRIFSQKDEDYINFFVRTFYTKKELKIIVNDWFVRNFERGYYNCDFFGKRICLFDFLSPDVEENWNKCKSVAAYKEKLFELNDITMRVVTLEEFLEQKVFDFEVLNQDHYPHALHDALTTIVSKHPVFLEYSRRLLDKNDDELTPAELAEISDDAIKYLVGDEEEVNKPAEAM